MYFTLIIHKNIEGTDDRCISYKLYINRDYNIFNKMSLYIPKFSFYVINTHYRKQAKKKEIRIQKKVIPSLKCNYQGNMYNMLASKTNTGETHTGTNAIVYTSTITDNYKVQIFVEDDFLKDLHHRYTCD